jgi:hypothetical protein
MSRLTDDELWLIRDALSARIDSDNFYSTDENGVEDQYDSFLKSETEVLFNKLVDSFK